MNENNEGVALDIPVKVKLLYEDSVMPFKATLGAAAFDCVAHSIVNNTDTELFEYGLGFAIELPQGYVGLLFPRSSSANRGNLMANCVGVIDSDYRGEVVAKFKYGKLPYNKTEKCAQLVIVKLPNVKLISADTLSETVRGNGGYGSTGQSVSDVNDPNPSPVEG